jgi:predicted enzyme related to lactoylglutathione lyase
MNEPMQPDQTSTIVVKVTEADTAVARVRSQGGVLLSFATLGGGRLALNVILPPAELLQEWDAMEAGR